MQLRLEKNESEIFLTIGKFYSAKTFTEQIQISKKLTELILDPIAGYRKDDEIISFGKDIEGL